MHRFLRPAVVGVTFLAAVGVACVQPRMSASARTTSCGVLSTAATFAGQVPSPRDVLGFDLGDRPVSGAQAVTYVGRVDHASARVESGVFAHSWQGRPLTYALVGSPQNLGRLDGIRTALADIRDPSTPSARANSLIASAPTVVWIMANVHGNEPAGSDAVLRLLYELADREDCVVRSILANVVVGLIPIQNPDGRAHDVRTNGYAFDMNRDWFTLTQPEVADKLALLWRYPAQVVVDEHEEGGSGYFFPPDADPFYAETPDPAYHEIANLFGGANAAAFTAEGWPYVTYQSPYDFVYPGYADTGTTMMMGAAGMTYEQGVSAPYRQRVLHHFTTGLVTLYTAATHRADILRTWRAVFVQAKAEGAACRLERNRAYNPGGVVNQQVPTAPVCGYFLRGDEAATRLLVRRLQLEHVQVQRLTAPLEVPDYTAYGGRSTPTELPAGTYWVTMDQAQKHWVQAMLNADTYLPAPSYYDVSAWSLPLLAGVAGGSTGLRLRASLAPVGLTAAPRAPVVTRAPRIGIVDQRPSNGTEYSTTGWLRWRLAQDWHLPYTALTPAQLTPSRLRKLDVLIMPDVNARPTWRTMGRPGRTALRNWVRAGGRFVAWQGGLLIASALGLSSVGLQYATAVSGGALLKLDTARPDTWALWSSYDFQMSAGTGEVIASFPQQPTTSGSIADAQSLGGSAVEAVDNDEAGSTTVFAIEPNFRGYTDATAALLRDAIMATPHRAVAGNTVRAGRATRGVPATTLIDRSGAARTVRDPRDDLGLGT